MITAVDTNVLVDILEADPDYGPTSREALKRSLLQGSVVACEVVWAEVATAYGTSLKKVTKVFESIGITYSPMTRESALEAAKCWYRYRKKGGRRIRIAADFLIGGHALIQSDRLLTRDKGFYSGNFQSLKLLV